MTEQWLPIPGLEGYEVSNAGRVRTFRMHHNGKILRPARVKKYQAYGLRWPDGKTRMMYAHRLVAAAFIGPRPEGLVINHIDGNKDNNTPQNLEYITDAENREHAARTGLLPYGERNGSSSLTEEKVREIRTAYASGVIDQTSLARMYGVTQRTVSLIVIGRIWKSVGGPVMSLYQMRVGERHPMAKLSAADIPVIRERLKTETLRAVSSSYGVTDATVLDIRKGVTWKSVK